VILADENIDRLIITALRNSNFQVLSIKEHYRGIKDEKIVELSRTPPQIILTNDKDFGSWVFAHGVKDISVVFLRYKFPDRTKMIDIVTKLLGNTVNHCLENLQLLLSIKSAPPRCVVNSL
jgi:predicted nuclease of predicted toxin-antitoxin system